MTQTIDINFIRYLNLFEKITKVRTKNCFFYNNYLIYAVPGSFVSRAIGENGKNVKRLAEILQKKIKIVALPEKSYEINSFISRVVSPITFKSLDVTENEVIISGNVQCKASLIGRNKKRLIELKKIIKDMLNRELRIV